jgi:hypothetical protein
MNLILLLALAASPLTLDEVLAKNAAARGGLEKLRAIKTLRIKMHNEGGLGYFETVSTYARGLKNRNDTSSQGMTESSAVDGKSGWYTNGFSGRKDAVSMSTDGLVQALEEADIDGPLIDAKAKGHRLTFQGLEDVDGSPAYKIKAVLKNGTVQFIFLDADAFIEIKIITQRKVRGALVEYESEYGNYAQIDGVYFPLSLESRRRRSQDTSRTSIDAVELNPAVDDAIFAQPGAKTQGAAPTLKVPENTVKK